MERTPPPKADTVLEASKVVNQLRWYVAEKAADPSPVDNHDDLVEDSYALHKAVRVLRKYYPRLHHREARAKQQEENNNENR